MWFNAMRSVCSTSSFSLPLRFVCISVFSSSVYPICAQNAPLTEQQQAAIATLCHAVAERPLPADLVSALYFQFVSTSRSLFLHLVIKWWGLPVYTLCLDRKMLIYILFNSTTRPSC